MELMRKSVDLQWLLDDLVARVAGVDRAVVLSADGLLLVRSDELAEEDAEHLCAVASAFQSLSRGAAQRFHGGRVHQTLVEMEHGFLFVMAAGRGACLAALAAANADLGLVAYEMNRFVQRLGATLSAAPRTTGSTRGGDNGRS